MTNKTPTPITDIITHLESYNQSHVSASSSLKSSIWDLNKARRQRGRNLMSMSVAFSALDVREELRAQTVLDCSVIRHEEDVEPLLEEEDEKVQEGGDTKNNSGDAFTVRCLIGTSGSKEAGDEKGGVDNASDGNLAKSGIRQRKIPKSGSQKNSNDSSKKESEWSQETYDTMDMEEEKLRRTDPLELFGGGMVPRDLRLAQKKAKESLASYVAAANEVAAIMQLVTSMAERANENTDVEGEN